MKELETSRKAMVVMGVRVLDKDCWMMSGEVSDFCGVRRVASPS